MSIKYHIHHIIPKHEWKRRYKSEKGMNDASNLEKLTIQDHANIHYERWVYCGDYEDYLAWKALSGQISLSEASKLMLYEGRKRGGLAHKGKIVSEEIKKKMRKPKSEQGRKNMSYPKSEKEKIRLRNLRKGTKMPNLSITNVSNPPRAKYWSLQNKFSGEIISVYNLKKFCRDQNEIYHDIFYGKNAGGKNWHKLIPNGSC
jgi:hypothetical protein